MVGEAVCGEEGVLDVQENWRFNQPCKNIPDGFATVLSEDYVEWCGECGEGGVNRQFCYV